MPQENDHAATNEVCLEDLILPGTPKSVADAYRSLADRARTARFGLLEDDVVVLDTETTGLDPERDEILTFSAVNSQGAVLFDAMFRPEDELTLKPGALYEPKGRIWMLALCGSDGVEGWKRTTAALEN